MEKKDIIFYGIGIAILIIAIWYFTQNKKAPSAPTSAFTVDLTNPTNAPLNSSGGTVATNGVNIVNTGSGFTALAQACTHQGCPLAYNKSGNDFVCPCHGGTFDINGNVTQGPPKIALQKFNVTQNGNILTIG